MRLAKVGASLVLVGVMTAACGGGDGPTDASSDEFCDAWEKTGQVFAENSDDWDKIEEAYDETFEVGTPENIDDDAREGFEILKDEFDSYDSLDDMKEAEEPGEEDMEKVTAFTDYQMEECGLGDDVPSDMPTDLPSDMPTDIPSDLPTEMPSE